MFIFRFYVMQRRECYNDVTFLQWCNVAIGIVFSEMMIYIFRKESVRLLFDTTILENEDPSAAIVSQIVDNFKSKNLHTENSEFSSSKMNQGNHHCATVS